MARLQNVTAMAGCLSVRLGFCRMQLVLGVTSGKPVRNGVRQLQTVRVGQESYCRVPTAQVNQVQSCQYQTCLLYDTSTSIKSCLR